MPQLGDEKTTSTFSMVFRNDFMFFSPSQQEIVKPLLINGSPQHSAWESHAKPVLLQDFSAALLISVYIQHPWK
jgi:hypothetical protein